MFWKIFEFEVILRSCVMELKLSYGIEINVLWNWNY